jgi:hypothetical protein
MKDKKQYYTKEAYLGNTEIITFVNGKKEFSDIVNDYNVEGYTSALEDRGYVRAYTKKEIDEVKEEIEYLRKHLKNIEGKPILDVEV